VLTSAKTSAAANTALTGRMFSFASGLSRSLYFDLVLKNREADDRLPLDLEAAARERLRIVDMLMLGNAFVPFAANKRQPAVLLRVKIIIHAINVCRMYRYSTTGTIVVLVVLFACETVRRHRNGEGIT
jgi:hypothetical protein